MSADGLTYTFRLRAGAKFHNGRALTPQDVIANIERVRDPKTGSPFGSRFTGIKAMEATGSDEVKITLDAPSAPFLVAASHLPSSRPKRRPDLGRKPDGTGPFRFSRMGARHLHRARTQSRATGTRACRSSPG